MFPYSFFYILSLSSSLSFSITYSSITFSPLFLSPFLTPFQHFLLFLLYIPSTLSFPLCIPTLSCSMLSFSSLSLVFLFRYMMYYVSFRNSWLKYYGCGSLHFSLFFSSSLPANYFLLDIFTGFSYLSNGSTFLITFSPRPLAKFLPSSTSPKWIHHSFKFLSVVLLLVTFSSFLVLPPFPDSLFAFSIYLSFSVLYP